MCRHLTWVLQTKPANVPRPPIPGDTDSSHSLHAWLVAVGWRAENTGVYRSRVTRCPETAQARPFKCQPWNGKKAPPAG